MRRAILHDGTVLKVCVYCHGRPESRDHVIARAFYTRPVGVRLPAVPACHSCNQGASRYEHALWSLLQARDSVDSVLRREPAEFTPEERKLHRDLTRHAERVGKKIACGLVAYRWGQLRGRRSFGPVRIGSEALHFGLIWSASVEGFWFPVKDVFAPEVAGYGFVRRGGRIHLLVRLGVLHLVVQCPDFNMEGAL